MRRLHLWAALAVSVVVGAGLSGCTTPGEPVGPTAASVNAIGDPSDTASPVDTARPVPTESIAPAGLSSPTGAPGTGGAPPVEPGVAALAACLNGNWSAPVSREFGALGMSARTKGAVRGGTGLLRLTFGRDSSFTFTYDQVTLSLPAGQAVVNGPVSGTWSLEGNILRTVLLSSQTKVDVKLGPVTVGAPASVASAVETLPPSDVMVTCATNVMTMQLSTADGGGIVTFDRA